jgi:uncharacterized membrane protein
MNIPAKYASLLFGFFLSCFMSFMVSGISTVRAIGFGEGLAGLWFSNWITSWVVAFPVVLVVAPVVRKLVSKLIASPQ